MIPLTVTGLARVLGAELAGEGDENASISDVTADSRRVGPGSLFVALPGEHADGHIFVAAARRFGAAAALTARRVPDGGLCVVTRDPLAALGRLARYIVDSCVPGGLRVLGITGSQGKTSTKDLLAEILENVGSTVAPIGNLNNELGLPLTVTRVQPDTRFLVAEMGARGLGHIAYLCQLVPPQVGVVLNVGHAHVGEFGSQAAIALAKSELVAALPADGVAVLNAADPLVWAMRAKTSARVVAASDQGRPSYPEAVWATDVRADQLGRYGFTLHSQLGADGEAESQVEVQLRLAGRHQVANAVAAAAAALAVGVDLESCAAALTQAEPRSRWRMELHERADGVVVVNDSYNANPDSMRAALDALAEIGARRAGGSTTWALLGDMLELGSTAEAEHAALGRSVAGHGVGRLVAVGAYADLVVDAARLAGLREDQASAVDDKAAMTRLALASVRAGDTVLVKASRGLALNTVAEEILNA
jgi:UDP-N-acetylmuramoyl-tripeptide--D-alanyl-D-alanine ligase